MDAGGRATQEQLPRHEEHEVFTFVFLRALRGELRLPVLDGTRKKA
jgi:hypothetical protein